jgi:Protein of unknown function (DUF2599)
MSQSFTKALSKMLTAIFVFSIIATSLPVNAAESKNSIDDLKKIQNNIREKDPQKTKSEKLETKSKDIQISKQKDNDIEIDSFTKQIRIKSKSKGETTIGIPNGGQLTDVQVIDNQVIFSNRNSKFDVIAEAVDGGMRQVINIKDSSAPTTYDFPVDLKNGETLKIENDGSASVKDVNGKNKLVIVKPWAKDASNKDLKTYYSIYESSLRQTIELNNASFPVVADPGWCGDYFFQVFWENRPSEGGLSLRNFPTWCGRFNDSGTGFDEIISKAPANSAWPSYTRSSASAPQGLSMFNQYKCHVLLASWFKESYNLEPNRPVVSFWNMIQYNQNGIPYPINACNP